MYMVHTVTIIIGVPIAPLTTLPWVHYVKFVVCVCGFYVEVRNAKTEIPHSESLLL